MSDTGGPAHAYAAEQGIRRYHVEGMHPHPISVTSLIKVMSPPTALTKWVDRKIVTQAVDTFVQTQDYDRAISTGLQSRWSGSEEADLGTTVHYLTEVSDLQTLGRTIVPQPVTDKKKAMAYVRQYEKCREEHGIQIIATEVTLVNREVGYAGTADRIAIVPAVSPDPIIMDLKSGKNIYPDVALQCAALAHCDEILYDDGSLHPIPWTVDRTRGIAVHVRPRSCRLIPLDVEQAWPFFQPLALLAKWKTETVKVLGEPMEPDEELSMRAQLRLRMKLLPADLAEVVRAIIKTEVPGNTTTWTVDEMVKVGKIFEPFEAESRERKQKVLDRLGAYGSLALRTKILSLTGGRTSMLDDLCAAEIDALLGDEDGNDGAGVAA